MTTVEELHPRSDLSGRFVDKAQNAAQIEFLAPSPELREQASRDTLLEVADNSAQSFAPLDNDFERDFHGNPDALRVVALASDEGMAGIVTLTGHEGDRDVHNVILARSDEHGVVHTLDIPFETEAGATPTTIMVLDALLADSASLNDVDGVEDWASQYGYELDDQAVAAYQSTLQFDGILRDFLTDSYDNYLWGEQ